MNSNLKISSELKTTAALAVVFPGQGSQSIGMLAELAVEYPVIKEAYSLASEVLGYDLWTLTQEGPEEKLNQTEYAQPAMLTAGVGIWRVLQQKCPLNPAFLAGHSLGEYTALVCAGAIDFADAVSLVAKRGRCMQEAVPIGKGAMAAIIGLDDEKIQRVCKEAAEDEILSVANYNSIGQIVLAGQTAAIERAIVLAKQLGAKIAKVLSVSVPSHCAIMKPAADCLADSLNKISIKSPQIPVIHNADVVNYSTAAEIRTALLKQLYSPVRWVETIKFLEKQGVKIILECGPGKVLTGLNKRISGELIVESLGTKEGVMNYILMNS